MLLTTTETFNTSLFTSPKSYTAFYSLIHWQESETHFISKKKKLHFNYWQSLNKSKIISRMYIYTTTTNCPLPTQPPPDSTYHLRFEIKTHCLCSLLICLNIDLPHFTSYHLKLSTSSIPTQTIKSSRVAPYQQLTGQTHPSSNYTAVNDPLLLPQKSPSTRHN